MPSTRCPARRCRKRLSVASRLCESMLRQISVPPVVMPRGCSSNLVGRGRPAGRPSGTVFVFARLASQASKVIGEGCVSSYLDDAVLAGPRDSVVEAFKVLDKSMADIGLHIRRDKCEAFSGRRNIDWPFEQIPLVSDGISTDLL